MRVPGDFYIAVERTLSILYLFSKNDSFFEMIAVPFQSAPERLQGYHWFGQDGHIAILPDRHFSDSGFTSAMQD